MTLDAFSNEIDGYRAQAAEQIRQFRDYQSAVKNDHTLSNAGKNEKIAEARTLAKDAVAVFKAKEETAVANKLESLQKSLHTRLGSTGADVMAMRDAEERADKLEDQDNALRALQRAVRSDDHSLAHAIIRRSNDNGWSQVIDTAATAYPAAGEALRDISTLTRFTQDIHRVLEREAAYLVGDR